VANATISVSGLDQFDLFFRETHVLFGNIFGSVPCFVCQLVGFLQFLLPDDKKNFM